MWSTSAWGRGMTCTEMSSPTFSAAAAHTVSATAARAGAGAMQLEINSALLMEDSPAERFSDVLAALAEVVEGLGAMLCARGE